MYATSPMKVWEICWSKGKLTTWGLREDGEVGHGPMASPRKATGGEGWG